MCGRSEEEILLCKSSCIWFATSQWRDTSLDLEKKARVGFLGNPSEWFLLARSGSEDRVSFLGTLFRLAGTFCCSNRDTSRHGYWHAFMLVYLVLSFQDFCRGRPLFLSLWQGAGFYGCFCLFVPRRDRIIYEIFLECTKLKVLNT